MIVAAVVVQDGRVLMVRRRVPEGTLSWQLPGGRVEPGESPAQAAVREVREETGLLVRPGRLLGARRHPETGRRMVYVACAALAGEAVVADPDELAEVAWWPVASLPTPVYAPVAAYVRAGRP